MFHLSARSGLIALLGFLMLSSSAIAGSLAVFDPSDKGRMGIKSIIEALGSDTSLTVRSISSLDEKSLQGTEVLIIQNSYPVAARPFLKKWVEHGGRLLLTHDAAGSGRPNAGFDGGSPFPEISNPRLGLTGNLSPNKLIVIHPESPFANGIPGGKMEHTYSDFAPLTPGTEAAVHAWDGRATGRFDKNMFEGNQPRLNAMNLTSPAILSGEPGKGRVIFCGLLFGVDSEENNIPVTGEMKALLLNMVGWLAGTVGPLPASLTAKTQEFTGENAAGNERQKFDQAAIALQGTRAPAGTPARALIRAFTDTGNSWLVVETPDVRVTFAAESGVPTLQTLQIRTRGWHPTWNGIERNAWSTPLLRLTPTQWPFRALYPDLWHERAAPEPDADVNHGPFADQLTVSVGKGTAIVRVDGTITLDGFHSAGMIALDAFDFYQTDEEVVRETAGYDLPRIEGEPLWMVKPRSYALGGNFEILDQMGESGLSPGLERLVIFRGGDIQARQITGTSPLGDAAAADARSSQSLYRPIRWRQLIEKRPDRLMDFQLPTPIELFRDDLSDDQLVSIANWRITSPSSRWRISWYPGQKGEITLPDAGFVEANAKLDPRSEDGPSAGDGEVLRRVFVSMEGDAASFSEEGKLEALDKEGAVVATVNLDLRALVTIPQGVFTYFPTYSQHQDKMPLAFAPRLTRLAAICNMHFMVENAWLHFADQHPEPERSQGQAERMLRYGVGWVPNMQYAKQEQYAELFSKIGTMPHVLAWYISDEEAKGEPGSKDFKESYPKVNQKFQAMKALDPKRPAFNLIYPGFTSIPTAVEHLQTDIFSWDTYGLSTRPVVESAREVDSLWRQKKDRPAWVTLQIVGPGWYDAQNLWFNYRVRSLAAFNHEVDGINYYVYADWGSQPHRWYSVLPGPKGPIVTPRWLTAVRLNEEIEDISDLEFRIHHMTDATQRERLLGSWRRAVALGEDGYFTRMHAILDEIETQIPEIK